MCVCVCVCVCVIFACCGYNSCACYKLTLWLFYFQVEEKHKELHKIYLETQEKLKEVNGFFDFKLSFNSQLAVLHACRPLFLS